MDPTADRYRKVAGRFTEVARSVPVGAWDEPAPCEGWVARDVVGHLVGWVPALLRDGAGIDLPNGPSVDDDPAEAWERLSADIQALLDDPSTSALQFDHPRAGRHTLDQAVGMFILGDVLVHTWDLARATGQDERLDPDEVHAMLVGLESFGDGLEQSGQYGARVQVPDDADELTRMIALTGRQP